MYKAGELSAEDVRRIADEVAARVRATLTPLVEALNYPIGAKVFVTLEELCALDGRHHETVMAALVGVRCLTKQETHDGRMRWNREAAIAALEKYDRRVPENG